MKPIDEIIELGCRFYGIQRDLLLSQSREEYLVHRRFSIMKACRDHGHRLNAIGQAFKKDHGAVIHGLRVISPEKFGLFWEDHERFIAVSKSENETPTDPTAGILRDIDHRLFAIQAQIDTLEGTKQKLLSAKQMFQ